MNDPSNVEAYINLALCFKDQNDIARAISNLENAMKLSETDYRIYTNLGAIYFEDEKYEDAIVNFLKA